MTVDNTTSSREAADAKALRRAFGTFATGVTVVTTGGPIPHAMTANSFTSVSLDPPLVLVCVDRNAVMHRCLTSTEFFGVSVLADHQEAEARHFADRWRTLGAAQFDNVGCLPGELTGVPLMEGALARFECELWRTYDGGDHTIFIGKVLSMDQQPGRDGLLVFNGKFRQITPDWSEVTA
ncbi:MULTISPECIES: flavin reductase family protein [Streptosporangium]|uniref:Flavin reductase (DIM6/NTAB) family NADH-FMN oxidoreductase RutF n=1 Tax=Streptosporangium brasiliense TaxID=47480 RepID=A0ABT9RAX6_9ACTN|nr:flavin reductase family protein [Streptosporangium brasiliense]MDP9866414.1 flavin reductase (DIM6/NTAB) family NADH-FMN oxidoreductase RutF [Streptosporangium brasiliense]